MEGTRVTDLRVLDFGDRGLFGESLAHGSLQTSALSSEFRGIGAAGSPNAAPRDLRRGAKVEPRFGTSRQRSCRVLLSHLAPVVSQCSRSSLDVGPS